MHPVFAFIDAPIIIVILGLGVLLFGADRIPKLARSMGEAKEFEAASARTAGQTPPPASDPPSTGQQTPPAQPPPNHQ